MERTPSLLSLCASPSIHAADELVAPDEIDRVLACAGDPAWLRARGVTTRHNFTGFSCELPVAGDPVLAAIAARIYATVGLDNAFGATLRFRRYAVGEYHPPHLDVYAIRELRLVATAMLCLRAPTAGGETLFSAADPAPVRLPPRTGRLLWWFNVTPDGQDDPSSLHESLAVIGGEKITLTAFIYRPSGAPFRVRTTRSP